VLILNLSNEPNDLSQRQHKDSTIKIVIHYYYKGLLYFYYTGLHADLHRCIDTAWTCRRAFA